MKKTIFWVFFALISGALLGRLTFDRYKKVKTEEVINYDSNVYMIKYKTFNSVDDMNGNMKNIEKYIYADDGSKVTAYLAITKTKSNAKKFLKMYQKQGLKVSIEQVTVNNSEFIANLNEYEKLLSATDDEKSIVIIEKQILACYTDLVVKSE